MAKMLLVFVAIGLAGVTAEPPVGREYLPPSQGGAPGSNALSTQYGVPGVIGGNPALDGRYGAPLGGQYAAPLGGRYTGPLGGRYAAPLGGRYAGPLGGRYAGPLGGRYAAPLGGRYAGAPAGSYAAPGVLPGALATQYGAPSAFDIGRPSAEYGVPFGGSRFGAAGSGYAPGGRYATGGYNGDYDPLAEPANYEFSYDVNDPPSGNEFGHAERRQGEVAQGRYYVVLPDGRRQVVDYQADQDGYKPQVRYEDSGRGYAYAAGGAAGREGYAYAGAGGKGSGGYTY